MSEGLDDIHFLLWELQDHVPQDGGILDIQESVMDPHELDVLLQLLNDSEYKFKSIMEGSNA